jgi:hypothetical protein
VSDRVPSDRLRSSDGCQGGGCGYRVLSGFDPNGYPDDAGKQARAAAAYNACISRYAPPGSSYRGQADGHMKLKFGSYPYPDDVLRGVLEALREDVRHGTLSTFEELVHADVYADLIAQAEGLLRDGYARAATVVAGAALEEHIKLLATKHGTGTTNPDGSHKKASVMNAELRKAGLYTEAQRATIEGWQKLRNDAAHGNPGFDHADTTLVPNISPMIQGARAFIATFPA